MTAQRQENFADVGELFYEWTEVGQIFEGHYLGEQDFLFTNGDTGKRHYFFVPAQGVVTMLGTYQLNERLPLVVKGANCRITFVDERAAKGGPSPLKVFRVQSDASNVLTGHDTVIAALETGRRPVPVDTVPGSIEDAYGNAQMLRQANAPPMSQHQAAQGIMPLAQQANLPPPSPVTFLHPQANALLYAMDANGIILYGATGEPVYGWTQDGHPLNAGSRLIAVT